MAMTAPMSVQSFGKGMPSSAMRPPVTIEGYAPSYGNVMPVSSTLPPMPMKGSGKPVTMKGIGKPVTMKGNGKGIPTSVVMGSGMMPPMTVKGYGKGMPTSQMMAPMPVTGTMMGKGAGKSYMLPASQPVVLDDEPDDFWGGLLEYFEDEEEYLPVMNPVYLPPQQPDMVPIPLQKKDDDGHLKREFKEEEFDALKGMSDEQLREMALMRRRTIENLKREVDELTNGDSKHEARLAALERKFGHLCHGSDLKFKAPLLAKISNMVRESHLLDHAEEMDIMKTAAEEWEDVDPWKYMHADNLVMGRGFMRLDHAHIEKMKLQEQIKKDQHPVVHRMHYAGHIHTEAEEAPCVFVKEAGLHKKQPLHPAPYRNSFWLSLDGPTRHDVQGAKAAKQEAKDALKNDPVARRVLRQDVAGQGEDAKPIDYLGLMEHGDLPPEAPKRDIGFVMPSWMY